RTSRSAPCVRRPCRKVVLAMTTNLEQGQQALATARYEVLPVDGVLNEVAHLDAGSCVTVTSSQTKGVDATVTLAEQLTQRQLRPVPHLAARLIQNQEHLVSILDRLATA